MEFGWINVFGIGFVLLLLIPNINYAKSNIGEKTTVPKGLNIVENIGRYGCIILMWLPLFVWEFGFNTATGFAIYIIVNCILIISYYVLWIKYWKKQSLGRAIALAIIPTLVFLISGTLLHHFSLVFFSILFGVAHCRVTYLDYINRQ